MNGLEHGKKVLRFTHRKVDSVALDGITRTLDCMSWDDLLELGVYNAYDYFISFIKELLYIYAPLKEVVIPRKYAIKDQWITRGLLKSSFTLDRLYKRKLKHPPDHEMHVRYKEYRNLFNKK